MAIAITITGIEDGVDLQTIVGTLAFTGSYPTGGDTIDWTTVVGVQIGSRIFIGQALPTYGSVAGSTGDSYAPITGTLLNNGKVKINTTSNTELSAGAYPARITGDTNIFFSYTFPRLQ